MYRNLWAEKSLSLFISHVHTKRDLAADLKEHLEPYWISAFVAHADVEPTKEWLREIEQSLRDMDAMLCILSQDFHSSNWTDQEVGFAVCRGVLIVPLKFDIDPYGFIGSIQALSAGNNTAEDVSHRTVELLLKDDRTRDKTALCLAHALRYSNTYKASNRVVKALNLLPRVNDDIIALCNGALEKNNQLTHVRGKLTFLLQRWQE